VQKAIDLKRLEEADFASSELVQRTPDLDVSHDLRGSVLDLMGRYREAEMSFRSAARIEPGRAYYHGRAAWAVLDQGHIDKAVEEATALVARFPDDDYPIKVLRAAADKLREQKQPQKALTVARNLIAYKALDENILEAVLSIQEIEKHVNVNVALGEAWALLDAFPHNAAAQRVVRYCVGGLRSRDRDAEALAEARKLLARFPHDQDTKALFAHCRLTDAEESMSATQPGSYIILNKAQAAHYEAALAEVEALDVTDPNVRASIVRKREYLVKQTKTRVKLSFGKVVLAFLALVFFFIGIASLPGSFFWLIVAGLLGWLFYVTAFKKQYQLNYKEASPEVRRRGIQK
jgi:tetratricopeptide (TPR) repeat protein